MEYCDLHVHSSYSFLDGWGRCGQVFERAKELGRKYLAITDHDSTSAFVLMDVWGKEFGIKPIYGTELRIVSSIAKMKETKSRKKYHITLLAHNQEGTKNLNRLVTEAWDSGFYYYPTIDSSLLMKHMEGLIVMSGCPSGLISQLLINDERDEARRQVKACKTFFEDNFYLEIQPHDLDISRKANAGLLVLSKELNIPLVLTTDAHFCRPEQRDVWRALNCIKRRVSWDDGHDMIPTASQMPEEEMLTACMRNNPDLPKYAIIEAMERTIEIAERCNASLHSPKRLKYISASGETGSHTDLLKEWCVKGFDIRGLKMEGEYLERFEKEADMVVRKDFVDYFLILSDMVKWAKRQGIFVGPARGSAAGSLMCYLLEITEVDPIFHDLLFERFLSEDRHDPPDIDIDFEDGRRDEVEQYLYDKYGHDHVAGVVTFAMFKRKNTLADLGKIFKVPDDEVKQLKAFTFERSMSGDSRQSVTFDELFNRFEKAREIASKYPIVRMAKELEWQFRHWSQHACGIALSQDPLTDTVALFKRKGRRVIDADWNRAEQLNILKLDLLGLRSMTIIKWIAERVGLTKEQLYSLPIDDEKTIEGFKKRDVLGIFQLDGGAGFSLIKQMDPPPSSFIDVAILNALMRPGALHSGTAQMFMDARFKGEGEHWGVEEADYATRETNGFIMFQEQVMEICRKCAGMEWKDISMLRKTMAKKLGLTAFDKYRDTFYDGCNKKEIGEEVQKKMWAHMMHFGSYGFNKSHAVSYALIAYIMMYLKQHHPLEFYWAMLCGEDNGSKRKAYMREAIKRGVTILSPRIGKSKRNFTIEGENAIRGSLIHIKGLGNNACSFLADALETDTVESMKKRFPKNKVNKTVYDTITNRDLLGDDERDFYNLYESKRLLVSTPFTAKIGELPNRSFKARKVVFTGWCGMRNLKSMEEVRATQIKGRLGDRTHADGQVQDEWMLIKLHDDTGDVNVHLVGELWIKVRDLILSPDIQSKILVVSGVIPPNHFYLRAGSLEVWEDSGIKRVLAECLSCSLNNSEFVPPETSGSNICFVGEAPGFEEVKERAPFVGKAGMLLLGAVEGSGHKRGGFDYQNSCLCRPVDGNKNRTPTEEEVEHCNARLLKELEDYDSIICLGRTAYGSVTGESKPVNEFDGVWTTSRNGIPVIGTYHPSYGLRENNREFVESRIKNAIGQAIERFGLKGAETKSIQESFKENEMAGLPVVD